jgi:beta-galactosidase
VITPDREQISADGEDVAMFAIAVQDAQGRVVPITDNVVTFKVSGAGKLIGVGNGDPTDQEPDKGNARKAFSGYCMAIAQASKTADGITVEASSPGLTSASVTVQAKTVELRPQVPVWAREVPKGSGVTGLWRPVPATAEATGLISFLVGNGITVFTLRQDGTSLTGSVEGAGGGFFGGSDAPVPITEGKVNGNDVSFKSGNSTYVGKINGDQLELERKIVIPFRMTPPAEPTGPRPAIGPPPDGSDPSFNLPRRMPQGLSVVLHRVEK